MKKESKRKAYSPEESERQQSSLHDLYFTEDIDIEEELRLMEADPRLKDVTGDPEALDKIKAEWAKMNTDVEMSEDVPKVRAIRKRNKRIFFAVAAIIVLSMAASSTGVTSLYKYLEVEDKGAEEQLRLVDSENDAVRPEEFVDQMDIYQEVDKFFESSVVKLYGHLAGLEFKEYILYEEDRSAEIMYYWEGKSIFYSIQSNYNQLSQMSKVDDVLLYREEIVKEDITIIFEKYSERGSEIYYHIMSFEYNNLYYKILFCTVDENIIKKIVDFIYF